MHEFTSSEAPNHHATRVGDSGCEHWRTNHTSAVIGGDWNRVNVASHSIKINFVEQRTPLSRLVRSGSLGFARVCSGSLGFA